MTLYEREARFKVLGFSFGNKKGNEVNSPEPLLIREEWTGKALRVSLRGNGQWRGGYIKVVNPDKAILGRHYDSSFGPITMRDKIEVTLEKEEINKHPLVGQLLYWESTPS